jgi:hypothetical protein
MSYSNNVRKKQIKRCNKDDSYEFMLNGNKVKYVGNPIGYKLSYGKGYGDLGGFEISSTNLTYQLPDGIDVADGYCT